MAHDIFVPEAEKPQDIFVPEAVKPTHPLVVDSLSTCIVLQYGQNALPNRLSKVIILYFEPSIFRCILLRWVRLLGFTTVYGTITLKLHRY
ncbi:hypothetical protein JD844_003325 [Phrynosoma platyrhinos]|uniref:Uncharacterized protein n=1 Tax=Phrynosoma platyrhinos TaxID=52577 RepID=A0ABQ7TDL3_PHRPL|nr:hypothetical protein JD844_003325 [Phrynosoma platyrhinos]